VVALGLGFALGWQMLDRASAQERRICASNYWDIENGWSQG